MAQADVMRTRIGSAHVPTSVIAAVREQRSLQRLQRRIALLSRLHLIR
jgi:regulator of protease activity HflC (stomatin/prohibitin superfamily)